jgi:site-specific recombinase XerD
MMADIVIRENGAVGLPGEVLADVDEKAMEYVAHSKAYNTVRSYRSDWNDFVKWCEANGLEYLPATPKTVARYLTALSERCKVSTLQRRLSAISQAHKQAGFAGISTREEPLHSVWEGIRRTKGTAQKGKAPVLIDDIRAMVKSLPDNLLGIRDRALLLVGFAGAFRRSELVSLDVEDVEFTREGLIVHLRKSKTDQEGQGRDIGIPYGSNPATCPVRALQDWLDASGITSGPLFRAVQHGKVQPGRLSDKAVALVVKRCAKAAGLDASKYAGHSLRAGLATTAAMAGVSERAIMAQTGHKSVNMVRRYIRKGSLFTENAAASIGL